MTIRTLAVLDFPGDVRAHELEGVQEQIASALPLAQVLRELGVQMLDPAAVDAHQESVREWSRKRYQRAVSRIERFFNQRNSRHMPAIEHALLNSLAIIWIVFSSSAIVSLFMSSRGHEVSPAWIWAAVGAVLIAGGLFAFTRLMRAWKKFDKQRRRLYGLAERAPMLGWQSVVVEQFRGSIPADVVRLGSDINEACPQSEHFVVCASVIGLPGMSAISECYGFTVPDRFLVVALQSERYTVAAWNDQEVRLARKDRIC